MKFGKLFNSFFARFGEKPFTSNRVSKLQRNELILMAKNLRNIKETGIPTNYITLSTEELKQSVYAALKVAAELPLELVSGNVGEESLINNEDLVMSLDRQDLLALAKEGFEKQNYHITPRYDCVTLPELRIMVFLYLEQPDRKTTSMIIKVDPTAGEPPEEQKNK